MLGIARNGSDILLATVEELIDFSQIESGHLRHNTVTFELLPLLDEVMSIARSTAAREAGAACPACRRALPAPPARGTPLSVRYLAEPGLERSQVHP